MDIGGLCDPYIVFTYGKEYLKSSTITQSLSKKIKIKNRPCLE
jgi:hypothetical protein